MRMYWHQLWPKVRFYHILLLHFNIKYLLMLLTLEHWVPSRERKAQKMLEQNNSHMTSQLQQPTFLLEHFGNFGKNWQRNPQTWTLDL